MNRADLRTKDILNPSEAIELYVLSHRKFYKLLETKPCPGFVAHYKTRKLILRVEFEKYLMGHPELRRRIRDAR
ncbi:MAG: DNA-binding protein [Lachnospiraceae bacterium]|mgnify:CR=1 FL=1|nr:DNA-binding protein [Lachnospiraceae bacterium]